MNEDRPPETPGLEAVGVSLQRFVSEGSAVPPGTPGRPRPDRPRYTANTETPSAPSSGQSQADGTPPR
jgi:hypothetical protein